MAKLKKETKTNPVNNVGSFDADVHINPLFADVLIDPLDIGEVDPRIVSELDQLKEAAVYIANAVSALDSKVKGAIEKNNQLLIDKFVEVDSNISDLNSRISDVDIDVPPCSCKCLPGTMQTTVKEIVVDERQTVRYEENKQLTRLIKINKLLMVVSVLAVGVSVFL